MKKEITKIFKDRNEIISDDIAVEEPLEMIICYKDKGIEVRKTIAVTMRSPGDDFDLVRGFLFTENIISSWDGIERITNDNFENCPDPNRVLVYIKDKKFIHLPAIDRNFYTTSSCGICGKSGIDAIQSIGSFLFTNQEGIITSEKMLALIDVIFSTQDTFQKTGGIHATALYDFTKEKIVLREDVGRHNAMDKAIGALSQENSLPFSNYIAFVSGRVSFELVQKAYLAGIPMIAAIGAPTSLAVEFAKETGLSLIGFLKKERFNIYSVPSRIIF